MPLLHISTDYVFDGTSSRPYTEDDPTAPVNRYGETKLAGEQAVQASGCRGLIVRTQSLFGPGDRHFVAAIVRQLAKPDPALRVVSDQVSCPTYTRDAAAAILNLLRLHSEGIVHVSSEGACSWHDFARAIAARVRPAAAVTPVPAAAYARRARRPAHSVLDKARYRAWTGERLPHWEQALDAYLARFDAPARA
jgi:dTDP-4-dehydrorhamnose reductase